MINKITNMPIKQTLILITSVTLITLLLVSLIHVKAVLYVGAPIIMFAYTYLRHVLKKTKSPLYHQIPKKPLLRVI